MKINKKHISIVLISIMVLASMTGCTTLDNFITGFIDKPQNDTATIQIGVYQPVTGSDSEAAELEIKGIELAHEMYPSVDGKMVELVYADNASDIYAAETAIKELIFKEPLAILGSYGSVYSMVAGEYVKEAKIPAIAITNTNPLVTRNNDYYYRVCYVDSNQGDILAKYVLNEKKQKTAGVLLPTGDDAAMAMASAFTDRIKAETNNKDAIRVY
ncbi:MAG: ABC transporter substrate-binding protein [Firmicutes bacterium]|nr:ABC transporter substrate-binding protein [Bacillota bacterium]